MHINRSIHMILRTIILSYIIYQVLRLCMNRSGDHATLVYIVSQLMVVAMILKGICYFFYISFKLLLIYIDHVPGNQILILAEYNTFQCSRYACSNEQIYGDTMLSHNFNKKIALKFEQA